MRELQGDSVSRWKTQQSCRIPGEPKWSGGWVSPILSPPVTAAHSITELLRLEKTSEFFKSNPWQNKKTDQSTECHVQFLGHLQVLLLLSFKTYPSSCCASWRVWSHSTGSWCPQGGDSQRLWESGSQISLKPSRSRWLSPHRLPWKSWSESEPLLQPAQVGFQCWMKVSTLHCSWTIPVVFHTQVQCLP